MVFFKEVQRRELSVWSRKPEAERDAGQSVCRKAADDGGRPASVFRAALRIQNIIIRSEFIEVGRLNISSARAMPQRCPYHQILQQPLLYGDDESGHAHQFLRLDG